MSDGNKLSMLGMSRPNDSGHRKLWGLILTTRTRLPVPRTPTRNCIFNYWSNSERDGSDDSHDRFHLQIFSPTLQNNWIFRNIRNTVPRDLPRPSERSGHEADVKARVNEEILIAHVTRVHVARASNNNAGTILATHLTRTPFGADS